MLYFLSARCTSSPVFDCDCILHLFPQKCKREGDDLEWPPLMLWPSSAERLFLFHVCRGLRELVGAKPLHLLTQTAPPLKSPTGAFIATQTRSRRKVQNGEGLFPIKIFTAPQHTRFVLPPFHPTKSSLRCVGGIFLFHK